ncbi:MAG: cadherin-like domain-containing protein, partial [Pseudomonadales bacterium]|nr:cadherin-like domain-containing protein [Pseudomonadales bacterium]
GAVSFAENGTGTVVTMTASNDVDTVGTLSYSIVAGGDSDDFSIDGSTGDVTFTVAPDYEAPADGDTNNVYTITVQVSDGVNATDDQVVNITVTDVNDETPVITSSNTATVAENQTSAIDVNATDADGTAANNTITYTLTGAGADDTLFGIDGGTGIVTFLSAPDYEAPADTGADNVYNIQVQASDNSTTPSALSVTQDIAITVTDVNDETPVITSANTATVAENQTSAIDVNATDADGTAANNTITYTLTGAGADDTLFGIDGGTGIVTFLSAPDYEAPADTGADNVYNIQVQASDNSTTPSALSVTQDIAITVTDVNDNAPVITSGNSASVPENTTALLTVTTSELDTVGSAHTFSITGSGADDAEFTINGTTGDLSFTTAPDYESPTDTVGPAGDNVYQVEVAAFDGTNTTTQLITVSVTAVNDNIPTVIADAYNVDEGGTLNETGGLAGTGVLGNDSDADLPGDTLTVNLVGDVTYGTLTLNADGSFTYTHDNSENLADGFTYNVFDGVNTSITQAVSITVAPVNDAPVLTVPGT